MSNQNSHLPYKKLYLIVLMLMPIGIAGLGLVSASSIVVNISFSDVFFVFLFLFVVCSQVMNLYKKNQSAAHLKYAMAFLCVPLLSIWNLVRFNGSINEAALSYVKLLICILYSWIFSIYFRRCSEKEWKQYIVAASVSGLFFSISCIVGAVLFFLNIDSPLIDNYTTSFRATGFQEDPNLAAIFQVMQISYVLMWLRFTRHKRWVLVVLLISFIGAISTNSKACFLTMVATLLFMLGLTTLSRRKNATLKLLGSICVGVIAGAIIYNNTSFLDSLISRLMELMSRDERIILTGRNYQWESAINILLKNPLNILFGVGIGQFETVANEYNFYVISYSVHNTFLSFLVECGIVQLILLVGLMINLCAQLIKDIMQRRGIFSLYSLWGVLAIFIFMNSVNFQNNRMSYVFITFVYVSMKRLNCKELSL